MYSHPKVLKKLHKIFCNYLFIGLKMFHTQYKKFGNSDELMLLTRCK